MNEERKILDDIITDFSADKFILFFRRKYDKFVSTNEDIPYYDDTDFQDGKKLGEIIFPDSEQLAVFSFQTSNQLSERSSKKVQYEKGKKILKDNQCDAGIFIFYDNQGNFRFSLIYANYLGTKRDWSLFRRFTYFVSNELTNKTFLQRIGDGDFSSIKAIKDAFSVEKVTKEFYKDIAYWYFWAVKKTEFPKDAEKEENGRNIAVIRLITRLIFIWFMRVRGLVPRDLFEINTISSMLKDTSPESSTYYKAILQNLFFATLSTRKEKRKFRNEVRGYKGYNPDFGNQYVFRFQELFSSPDKLEDYFGEIPFLNGGLFECLDDKHEGIYIDGFTSIKKHQPIVPNFLFFNDETSADLNIDYGTKNKKYKVRGLINILSSFNFTIDENTFDDQDVALDPELLGRVFENLLASFNPETSTTARKATGSYYTPREIVDYMVTESLKAYFKNILSDIPDIESKLEKLFLSQEENPFNSIETEKLVKSIEDLRIVDPAVGSGAFPMGILNKLVYILSKVDPENELWKNAQLKAVEVITDYRIKHDAKKSIEKFFMEKNADYGRKLYLIQKCIYGVDIQLIAVEIAKLRFFISLLVDEKMDKTKYNWGIEPLPNLDFKIMQGDSLTTQILGINIELEKNVISSHSLQDEEIKQLEIKQRELSEEKLNLHNEGKLSADKKKNLDNHLHKIAKELDHLKEIKKVTVKEIKEDEEILDLISKFDKIKKDHQDPDINNKSLLREQIENLIIQIYKTKIENKYAELKRIKELADRLPNKESREVFIESEKQKFVKIHGFNPALALEQLREFTSKNKTKPFFLWSIYFSEVYAEKGGFDIVIGNPPYVQLQKDRGKLAKKYNDSSYETFTRTGDIYLLFYELGINILKPKGHLCFITSNKWMQAAYGSKLRNFLALKNPSLIVDLGPGVFKSSIVDTNIILVQNDKNKDSLSGLSLSSRARDRNFSDYVNQNLHTLPRMDKSTWFIGSSAEYKLKEKIERIGKPLKDWDVNINYGIKTGLNAAFIIANEIKERLCREDPKSEEILKPILRGKDIKRYSYKWAGLWLIASGFDIDVPKNYPAIYGHLRQFEEKAKKRYDQGKNWWNLRTCSYYSEFEKEKLVFKAVGKNLTFSLLEKNKFITAPASFMTSLFNKYILGYLCSSFAKYFIFSNSDKTGAGDIMLNVQSFEKIPIPSITTETLPIVKQIEKWIEEILLAIKTDINTAELERHINQLVYQLYELTENEIEIVEFKER